jgi:GT2 family glycosyltransferase
MGYKCAFAHDAIVYHKVSATGGGILNSYYDGRNFIWLLAKDVPADVLRANAGAILGEQAKIFWSALKAWRGEAARMRMKGQLAGVLGIPKMIASRKNIQAGRAIERAQISNLLTS